MVDGIPNCFYGTVTVEELNVNLSTPNLPSVRKMLKLIDKASTKERVNHLLICFSHSLSHLVPGIAIVKLGKDVTQPINRLCDMKATEWENKYGSVLSDHCHYLWSIAAYFLGVQIDLYDNDISYVFPQVIFCQIFHKQTSAFTRHWWF